MLVKLAGLILAKLLSPLSSFMIIVMIARIRGEEMLGQYNTIWVWMVMFQHLSIAGICEYISREVGANKDYAAKYLVHGVSLALLFALLSAALMIGSVYLLNYPEIVRQSIIIVSLALPFTAVILICQALFTAFQKIGYVAVSSGVENILFLTAGSLVIIYGHGLIMLIWALVMTRMLASSVNLFMAHKFIAPLRVQFDGEFFRKLLSPVIVFGLTGIAFQIFMRIDIIMLSKLRDMATVGLYSSASKLWEICLMLPLTFYFLNLPSAAEGYKHFRDSVHQKMMAHTEAFLLIIFCIFGFVIFFADMILGTFYGGAFKEASVVLRVLMFAFLIHSAEITLEISCQAAGYQQVALRIAIVRALINVILNFILIPIWGALGAALATLFSISISFAAFHYFVSKTLNKYQWVRMMIKPASVCAVVILILFLLADYVNTIYLAFLFIAGYALALYAIHGFSFTRMKAQYSGR